jgi:hypothetical protein
MRKRDCGRIIHDLCDLDVSLPYALIRFKSAYGRSPNFEVMLRGLLLARLVHQKIREEQYGPYTGDEDRLWILPELDRLDPPSLPDKSDT